LLTVIPTLLLQFSSIIPQNRSFWQVGGVAAKTLFILRLIWDNSRCELSQISIKMNNAATSPPKNR
jgi:hypothetical protein